MESLKTELEQAGVLDVTGDLLEQRKGHHVTNVCNYHMLVMNVGRDIGILDGEDLSNEWVSFVHNQGRDCPLTKDNIHKFHAHLKILSVKTRPQTTPNSTTALMPMYTSQDLDTLINGVSDDEDDMANIMSGYGGGESAMVKIKDSKMKSPPVRNKTITRPYVVSSIDDQSPSVQSVQMTNTPYSQRLNIRKVVCGLKGSVINDGGWVESEGVVKEVEVLSGLTDVVPHMYQTFSQKVDVMVNRMEEIGYKICQANHLPEATMETPLLTITTEPALYLGRVVCDGEGKLNAHSCLLQGVESFQHGYRHKLSQAVLLIPSDGSLPPSCLFPGQVIIVEGVLNHSRVLTPSKIYSHSCLSPNKPLRDSVNINALSGIIAAGPFALSDSLDMTPLHDLLTIVSQQKPHILVIAGPFIEDNHISLKNGEFPKTFDKYFCEDVLVPISNVCMGTKTKVIILPSQRDVCHQWPVYPQPPYMKAHNDIMTLVGDPSTVSINDYVFGVTSTDVLFHLSSRSLFIGSSSDRMSTFISHLFNQQSYYPLYPPYLHEESVATVTDSSTPCMDRLPEVSMDVSLAFGKEHAHAVMSVKPDILILPSNLRPFVKIIDKCLVINPGRITKKAGGGTYAKFVIPPGLQGPDPPCNTAAVQILNI